MFDENNFRGEMSSKEQTKIPAAKEATDPKLDKARSYLEQYSAASASETDQQKIRAEIMADPEMRALFQEHADLLNRIGLGDLLDIGAEDKESPAEELENKRSLLNQITEVVEKCNQLFVMAQNALEASHFADSIFTNSTQAEEFSALYSRLRSAANMNLSLTEMQQEVQNFKQQFEPMHQQFVRKITADRNIALNEAGGLSSQMRLLDELVKDQLPKLK